MPTSTPSKPFTSLATLLLLVLAGLWIERCQTSTAQETSEQPDPVRDLIHKSLSSFELHVPHQDDALTPYRALYWANNARETVDGLTVFWIANGRPEAVGAIFPRNGKLVHTLDSLSRGPLVAKENGMTIWQPDKAGLEFKAVPDAPLPSASKQGRQLQMKSIARQFGATMLGWKRDSSEQEVLRLLPRPLYSYTAGTPQRLDGAVFGFASGTDPEVLLLLEAIGDEGRSRWEFALVRQTSGELEVRYGNAVVWHVDAYPETTNPMGIHLAFVRPLPDLPKNGR